MSLARRLISAGLPRLTDNNVEPTLQFTVGIDDDIEKTLFAVPVLRGVKVADRCPKTMS